MDLEFKVPGIIFGVSLAVLIGWACIYPAQGSIGIALLAVTLSLGVNVILGVVALFVAAALFNMSFGELRSAYLKLGAIFAAPAAATSIIPNAAIGWRRTQIWSNQRGRQLKQSGFQRRCLTSFMPGSRP